MNARRKRRKTSEGLSRSVLALFSVMAMGPSILDVAPIIHESIWLEYAWAARDCSISGVSLLSAYLIPYNRIEYKALASTLALWRVFVMGLNIAQGDPIYSPVVLGASLLALLYFMVRCSRFKAIESRQSKDGEAFYALTPVHSIKGIFQAIFMPWHMGRYESRMVIEGDNVWCINRRRFRRLRRATTNLGENGEIFVPLGRMLNKEERDTLDALQCKRVIYGSRDCRNLLVAGNPQDY